MNAVSSKRMSRSNSDNRKSAIQNPKWLRLPLLAFVLVVGGAVAEAQQPAKIPRIGFLTTPSQTTLVSSHSGAGYKLSAILKAKISALSIAITRQNGS